MERKKKEGEERGGRARKASKEERESRDRATEMETDGVREEMMERGARERESG
jgi:hypothetical protein